MCLFSAPWLQQVDRWRCIKVCCYDYYEHYDYMITQVASWNLSHHGMNAAAEKYILWHHLGNVSVYIKTFLISKFIYDHQLNYILHHHR